MKILIPVVALFCITGVAKAQQHRDAVPVVNLSPIDCSVLSGTPLICVRNTSHANVSGIACTGFWGTTEMSVPGGYIAAGGTTIIKFAGKCEKTITIHKRDGTAFEIKGFDVSANTVLNIPDN